VSFHAAAHNLIDLPSVTNGDDVDGIASSVRRVSFLKTLSAREIWTAMIAKVTQRRELGPLRALPTVREARIERGMRLSLAQCAQLTLTSDVAWNPDFR
jgi:hypothetical protein